MHCLFHNLRIPQYEVSESVQPTIEIHRTMAFQQYDPRSTNTAAIAFGETKSGFPKRGYDLHITQERFFLLDVSIDSHTFT